MQRLWHKIALTCPGCDVEPDIDAVHIASDGELLILMTCPKCEEALRWKTNFSQSVIAAHEADKVEPARDKPLVPPLAKKSDMPGMPDNSDKEFLHDLGIGGDIEEA
jgi:uncharacterized C2H2 Zn-finger protein